MNPIEKRTQRIAESILENESLTADLDDEAAQALLDWGLDLAKKIARNTAGMDDRQAEESMYRPLRSLRRMLRTANKLAANPERDQLEKFLERASDVYGKRFVFPQEQLTQAQSLTDMPAKPVERVTWLRNFVQPQENQSKSQKQRANSEIRSPQKPI